MHAHMHASVIARARDRYNSVPLKISAAMLK